MLMKPLNNISRSQSIYRAERILGGVAEDIPPAQHSLVLSVCREPGRSQEALSRDLCLNKSTITRSLSQLEEHGYVIRVPDPQDKRILLVMPTEKLLTVISEVRNVSREWNRIILAGISEEEKEIFCDVLLRMEANAKAAVKNVSGRENENSVPLS